MIRLFGLVITGFTLAFAGLLAVVRLPPADPHLLEFLIAPKGCESPCWQGIEPGVTTVEQARGILQAHPWVTNLRMGGSPPDTYLMWDWSGEQPTLVDDTVLKIVPHMLVRDGVIRQIAISTLIPYGEIWSLMGTPSAGVLTARTYRTAITSEVRAITRHMAAYVGGEVVFEAQIACQMSALDFWSAPVTVTYGSLTPVGRGGRERWIPHLPCTR